MTNEFTYCQEMNHKSSAIHQLSAYQRIFHIRDKTSKQILHDITTSNGTMMIIIIIMCGTMQQHFTHEVSRICGAKGEANTGPNQHNM